MWTACQCAGRSRLATQCQRSTRGRTGAPDPAHGQEPGRRGLLRVHLAGNVLWIVRHGDDSVSFYPGRQRKLHHVGLGGDLSGPWSIPPAGGTVTVTIGLRVGGPGALTIAVGVLSHNPDPDAANDDRTFTFTTECRLPTPWWNVSTQRCEVCPPATPCWNSQTQACEACPAGQFWNPSSQQCEGACTPTSGCPSGSSCLRGQCRVASGKCEYVRLIDASNKVFARFKQDTENESQQLVFLQCPFFVLDPSGKLVNCLGTRDQFCPWDQLGLDFHQISVKPQPHHTFGDFGVRNFSWEILVQRRAGRRHVLRVVSRAGSVSDFVGWRAWVRGSFTFFACNSRSSARWRWEYSSMASSSTRVMGTPFKNETSWRNSWCSGRKRTVLLSRSP